jgi:hypothetical protein
VDQPGSRATVVGLAGIAGAISYSHMRELAQEHGQAGWHAHAFPLSVDGIEIVASLVLLADRRASPPDRPPDPQLLPHTSAPGTPKRASRARMVARGSWPRIWYTPDQRDCDRLTVRPDRTGPNRQHRRARLAETSTRLVDLYTAAAELTRRRAEWVSGGLPAGESPGVMRRQRGTQCPRRM